MGTVKNVKKLTHKTLVEENRVDEDLELANKAKTPRGKKYDFIKKVMKKSNSTDIAEIMIYCKNTNKNTPNTWDNIFRNTPNLNNIMTATDVHVETKVTPVFKEWCIDIEKFSRESFEVCHKIWRKGNTLHITGVSNSGKSYIPRSIRNGSMNCRRRCCQVSDNFIFGSCADKRLIYTNETWFMPQNIEEAKCILEGTEAYVNVKHQNERLLKRTPSLSTSNDHPWRHVMGEKETESRIYYTVHPAFQLKERGSSRTQSTDVADLLLGGMRLRKGAMPYVA